MDRAKGVRDIAPQEKIVMQKITDTLRLIFENYGFSPLETPILERSELYDVKFGQGENSDVIQESFRLSDKADRKLILRNELTVPLAIYLASNPNLRLPFKRYEMGKVFRNGPLKPGRYREFWQCDIDTVGVDNVAADAELIQIMLEVFKRLEIPVNILFNTRKLLNEILAEAGVKDEQLVKDVLIIMDKSDKMSKQEFELELNKFITDNQTAKILKILDIKNIDNQGKIENIEKELPKSASLKDIKKILELVGESDDLIFTPSLVRGQAYYTGPIFEVYAKDTSKINSSLAGGGRYDEMIGNYIGEDKVYPATGTSFGLSTIYDYLAGKIKDPQKTVTKVFVISMGESSKTKAREIVGELRANNIKTDLDLLDRNMKKNLEYVNSLNIPFALIVGEDEIKTGKFTLKNMITGAQESLNVSDLVKKLK